MKRDGDVYWSVFLVEGVSHGKRDQDLDQDNERIDDDVRKNKISLKTANFP